MRQRPEYRRFVSKSRNERVSRFKSFCGQTTDIDDIATTRRREGCRGAQTDLTLPEIFLVASMKHCSILAFNVVCSAQTAGKDKTFCLSTREKRGRRQGSKILQLL